MSFVRPELADAFWRWREVLGAALLALLGLWVATRGGLVLGPLGVGVMGLATGMGLLAWRRQGFQVAPNAAGIVEVDEGALRYLHPRLGGQLGLPDLIEVRVLTLRGRRVWRLKDAFGQALLIPLDAAGAEVLFDAFATLPGLTSGRLAAAIAPEAPAGPGLAVSAGDRLVWRRDGAAVLRQDPS